MNRRMDIMAYDGYSLAKDLRNAADNIERYTRRQADIDKKIELLKAKKRTIAELKTVYKKTVKKDKKIIDSRYKWKGSWYSNDFKRDTDKLIDEENRYYKRCLDNIHDEINNKILKLENERNRLADSILFWRDEERMIRTKIDNIKN